MDEKLDLQEREPEFPPEKKPPAQPKLTAAEARKKYGIRSLILGALFCWFGYDGWFNQDPEMLEHTGFNRIGAMILGVMLVYSLVMLISAALTLQRENTAGSPSASGGDQS